MCYWIITKGGQVVAEATVQHVTRDDMLDPAISQQVENFNNALDSRLDDTNFKILGMGNFALDEDDYDLPQSDPASGDNTPSDEEYGTEMVTTPLGEAEEIEPEVIDKCIGAKYILDEATNNGKNLATDFEGSGLGTAHGNPLLDTNEYKIELENWRKMRWLQE